MENKVVARTARYVAEGGIEAIRFNFRGVGQSEGEFDAGRGEREDLRALINYVIGISPAAKLAAVGFSFGAWIALNVGRTETAVAALAGLAPPIRMFDFNLPDVSSKPILIVYGENDQYTPAAAIEAWVQSAGGGTGPVESLLIPGVDHFFGARVDEVGVRVAEFLVRVL